MKYQFVLAFLFFAFRSLCAQDSAQVNLIGDYFISGMYTALDHDEDARILCASDGYGLTVLDADDPFEMEKLGNVALPGISTDVAMSGEYAYVVDGGLNVVSLEIYEHPEIVMSMSFEKDVFHVVVYGDYLYLLGQENTFYVLSIANPAEPHFVRSIDNAEMNGELFISEVQYLQTSAVRIFDNRLFIADEVCSIWSLDNPAQPELLGSMYFGAEGNCGKISDVAVFGDYAYFFSAERYIEIITVSIADVHHPVELDRYFLQSSSVLCYGQFYVYEDCLALAFRDALLLFSLDNPARPELRGSLDVPGKPTDLIIAGEYAILANNNPGIQAFWLGDPFDPEPGVTIGQFRMIRQAVVEHDLVVAGFNAGFGVLDMSDPDNIIASRYGDLGDKHVYVDTDGEYVYTAGESLVIYGGDDVNDLRPVGVYGLPGPAKGLIVDNDRLVVIVAEYIIVGWDEFGSPVTQTESLTILYDVTDPEAIEQLYVLRREDFIPYDIEMQIENDCLYIVNRSRLTICDISQPGLIQEIATLRDHCVRDFYVQDDSLFCIDLHSLYIYSLEDRERPRRVTLAPIPGNGVSIDKADSKLIVTSQKSETGRLEIYDATNPRDQILAGYYDTPGFVQDVIIGDDIAVVPDWYSLGIYNISESLPCPENRPSLPEFQLLSAYPNPFNSSTIISYSVRHPGMVELSLFDQLGRQMENVTIGHNSPGTHTYQMQGANLTSGTYLLKLTAADEVSTKKLTFMK